jgi:hypothetical protein
MSNQTAENKEFERKVLKLLEEELVSPSDDFVRYVMKRVGAQYKGKGVKNRFKNIVQNSIRVLFKNIEDLKTRILTKEGETVSGAVTTEEELAAYEVVKTILNEYTDDIRYKDTLKYFNVKYQGKWIVRFYFNKTKAIQIKGFNDEKRIRIKDIQEINNYRQQILDTIEPQSTAIQEKSIQETVEEINYEEVNAPVKKRSILSLLNGKK